MRPDVASAYQLAETNWRRANETLACALRLYAEGASVEAAVTRAQMHRDACEQDLAEAMHEARRAGEAPPRLVAIAGGLR